MKSVPSPFRTRSTSELGISTTTTPVSWLTLTTREPEADRRALCTACSVKLTGSAEFREATINCSSLSNACCTCGCISSFEVVKTFLRFRSTFHRRRAPKSSKSRAPAVCATNSSQAALLPHCCTDPRLRGEGRENSSQNTWYLLGDRSTYLLH